MSIGDRTVGKGHATYVIAEVGSNHNGSLDTAKKMIEVCSEAGVDAVKFQAFTRETLFIDDLPDDGRRDLGDRALLRKRWDVLPKYTVPDTWWAELAGACASAGVHFMCTPFSLRALEEIVELEPPAIKIASGDITWHELIAAAAGTGLPVILSTGASTLEEVAAAVGTAREAGAGSLALLHCVSSYPPDWHEARLRAIGTLRDRFALPVGLSDHSPGSTLPVAAAALGSGILEKHVTLDRDQEGLDHHFALEPAELADLVADLRHAEAALEGEVKTWAESEEEERFWVRRGIWVAEPISRGQTITRDLVKCLRPELGLPASALDRVVGAEARQDLTVGEPIRTEDLSKVDSDTVSSLDVLDIEVVRSEELARLCHRFFGRMIETEFRKTFPAPAIEAYTSKYTESLFLDRADDPSAVVVCAEDRDQVVGLVLGGPTNGGVASIDWVVVEPTWQGRGIGTAMLERATNAYSDTTAHKIVLYTETTEARDFYRRFGMHVEGQHPRHWWRLDHHCLALHLDADPGVEESENW